MIRAYSIGGVYGSNNAILVLEHIKGLRSNYKVQCQICKKDPELHGDAIYIIPSDYLRTGKLPCGCSKTPKYTKYQWTVIVKRKAEQNNHVFLGFVDSQKFDQKTKLNLHCNNCGNDWNSCSISNYVRDRTCPSCANISRANKKVTESSEWISRFRATGVFNEDTFSFERLSKTGRLWKINCKNCGDIDFIADRSNLVAGKLPCNCGTRGGFDVDKVGHFYILLAEMNGKKFVKFGISNYPRRRIVNHKKVLKDHGANILSARIFRGDGREVLAIESALKRELTIINKYMIGFRKETCSFEDLNEVLSRVSHLEEVTGQKLL